MSGQVELLSPQRPLVAVAAPTEDDFYASTNQEDRIRAVFEIAPGRPLPRVTLHTLARYHTFLSTQLTFPFRALCAETRPPITGLIRHIIVTKLLTTSGVVSRGLSCRVEGLADVVELPLVEIGVREEHPNAEPVDDFAYWYFNYL